MRAANTQLVGGLETSSADTGSSATTTVGLSIGGACDGRATALARKGGTVIEVTLAPEIITTPAPCRRSRRAS